MPEAPRIDEFAFVLLAGLVLIIVLMVAFSTPGVVNTTNETNVTEFNVTPDYYAHPINFGDFTVSYSLGTENMITKKNFEVSKGYFGENYVNMVGVVSNDKFPIVTSGFIEIIVEDANGAGNLIVNFNDQEVFNGIVRPGKVAIPLTKNQINESNVISIKAGTPGWKFWTNTVYKISSAKMGINFQGINFKTFTFALTADEVAKFKFGHMTFRAYGSQPQNDLIIRINDEIFFKGIPDQQFVRDFGNEIYLAVGANNITFSVDRPTSYDLRDVTLNVVSRS